MWASVTQRSDAAAPCSRTKHSATLLGGCLYVLGGRNGNLPLKDLWRYHLAENRWEELRAGGDCPPSLQEHTCVAHKDHLYVFGGELGFSACGETPLWIYSVKGNSWRKAGGQRGAAAPRGRRGHTALVYRGSMLIYGGYRDLRGSSNELWAFHFETESWHIISSGRTVSKSDSIAPPRHKHSAVIHDDTMWVYGGMTDLNERQDLWRIDLHRKRWHCVRAKQGKQGPGPLHSHAACRLPGCMLVFGGERAGQPSADLWRFHFGTEAWDRVHVDGPKPSARAEAVALAVSELLLTAAAANADADPASTAASPREPRSPTTARPQHTQHGALRRMRAGGSVDRANGRGHVLHNRVSPGGAVSERKYVFRAHAGNYVDGSERNGHQKQNGHHQSACTPNGTSSNLGFLKEISKLSQINLSRLAHHKCNYSVLDADEGERTVDEDGDGDGLGVPGPRSAPPQTNGHAASAASKLVKSQSANLLSRRPRPNLSSIPRRRPLPRDNASVPNFTTLASSLPTPVLTPVEAARLVFLDSDEPEEDEELSPRGEYIRPASPGGPVGPGTPMGTPMTPMTPMGIPSSASRDFGQLHQQFTPKRRSESYTSHLGHAAELQQRQLQEEQEQLRQLQQEAPHQTQPKQRTIPKSASVRFQPHLEEVSDENVSSTSDYASIETMNRLSSASNYSVSSRPSPVDSAGGKASSRPNSGRKTPIKEGPISFCNPNYVGPEARRQQQQREQREQARKSWHGGMLTGSPSASASASPPPAAASPAAAAARLLNSPPDSLLEDPCGRSASQCFREDQEEVEMQQMGSPPKRTPRAPPQSLALRNTAHPACGHHHHHNHNHAIRGGNNKSRASSASRVERGLAVSAVDEPGEVPAPRHQPAAVYMFVVGGKEHGQVTVFRRPLSVWKLLLHHYAF
ncbi:hypothetical protein ONE63_008652 [Megalurothrips usitatus]|uniref:Tip elongation aberrant protein 1 n=1 Tax=Megalurothrips usitatus TaxID=439358 RepID=A0AAV7XQE8_9NEOP|nr:hypothetical protein ONE63_008652 [Megalurothrips usitatus]